MYQPLPSYDYDSSRQRITDYFVPHPTPAPDIFSPQTDPRSYHSQSPSYPTPPAQSEAYNGRNIYEPMSSPSVATTPSTRDSFSSRSNHVGDATFRSGYHPEEGPVIPFVPGSPFYSTPPWMYSPWVPMYSWPDPMVLIIPYPVPVDVYYAHWNAQRRYRAIGN